MYCLLVILYRQVDDFLIINDNPIRIPKIIVIIKLFSNSQKYNKNSASLQMSQINCFFFLDSKQASTTQKSSQEIVKPLNKGHKKGTNDLL